MQAAQKLLQIPSSDNDCRYDFVIQNYGSVLILHCLTRRALEHIRVHFKREGQPHFPESLIIRPGAVPEIVEGIVKNGLRVRS